MNPANADELGREGAGQRMKDTRTAEIERDFPAWMVWMSQRGEYWGAVRRDPRSSLPATVIADSERELREALAAQPSAGELSR